MMKGILLRPGPDRGRDRGEQSGFCDPFAPGEMSRAVRRSLRWNTKMSGIRRSWSSQRGSVWSPVYKYADVAYLGRSAPGSPWWRRSRSAWQAMRRSKNTASIRRIRYLDALDDTYISDPMKVSIDVKNLTGLAGIVSNPVYLSLLVAAIIGIVYAILHFRKKNR